MNILPLTAPARPPPAADGLARRPRVGRCDADFADDAEDTADPVLLSEVEAEDDASLFAASLPRGEEEEKEREVEGAYKEDEEEAAAEQCGWLLPLATESLPSLLTRLLALPRVMVVVKLRLVAVMVVVVR